MFLLEACSPRSTRPDLVFSASDLVTASECEYRVLRVLDEKLGRTPRAEFAVDGMAERAALLGDVHERRVLDGLVAEHGLWSPDRPTGVYDVAPAVSMDRATLAHKHEESVRALHSGASVVFQAAFFDGVFHGRSDFLVRRPDSSYAVWDTKLARRARVGALLQLAAYGDQLQAAGIPTSPEVTLVLGDTTHTTHSLPDLLPVFRERRIRFLDLVGEHRDQPHPVEWGVSGLQACGRCPYCTEQVEVSRDLLLVAGMTTERRAGLRSEGVLTIEQLAAQPPRAGDPTSARLRDQARLQVGVAETDGGVVYTGPDGTERSVSYRVLPEHTLGTLPAPSPGDIFFDFEGDPLWQDPVDGSWGIEYLFGVLELPASGGAPPFHPFWAHTRAEERSALARFLDYVAERRRRFPELHIYHYAAYERSALRRLSLTHVIGEDAVDTLLREGVLVDLYDTVRHSLRLSERSYSLKKLEPLYMGSNLRSGDVTDAGASVVAYAAYCAARDDGDAAAAAQLLAGISDYNRYDCLSTLGLRDWLLGLQDLRATGDGDAPTSPAPALEAQPVGERPGRESDDLPDDRPDPAEARLLHHLTDPPEAADPADQQAIALVAAAVGYHRRERKHFWWSHFDRLAASTQAWEQSRDVLVLHTVEVHTDWARPTPRSNPVRVLRATARIEPGAEFREGSTCFAVYAAAVPEDADSVDSGGAGRGGWFGAELLAVDEDTDGTATVLLRERSKRGAPERSGFPVALTPDQPLRTRSLEDALAALAEDVAGSLPDLPAGPALDLLRRLPPRLDAAGALPPVRPGDDGYVAAITAALQAMSCSYLAVQGPPGTGKTHVGAAVIERLVRAGWKIGVVAQSHAVVENLLGRAIDAGVPAERVAKKPRDQGKPGDQQSQLPWSQQSDQDVARLVDDPDGCLIGGTAWTMTGRLVPAEGLDLLVVDEAGQFSLANTMAVARAARRLLLLGDPQQLPQVTQGTHPAPVDDSALGWLSAEHTTLPARYGYFLADTWRMHPALCRAVSHYAYEGRLETAPAARERSLDGAAPGIDCVVVEHAGNTTSSPEEAAEVRTQVGLHLGLPWTPAAGAAPRPLDQADILVVAPYNAQVRLVRRVLDAAGYAAVRVGTVDRFQGQQSVVVLLTLAASSAAEAARGAGFLLDRHRINVALSRGQWRAVIIRSPRLTHYLPGSPDGLEDLGAFIGLCQPGHQGSGR